MVKGMRHLFLPADQGNLRSRSGAFDLPSVLIGVAVVAILAIGVMAAIFGVIPWAQDRAAKQDLAAITTAQGTTYAQAGSFSDKAALVAKGWLGGDAPEGLDTRTDNEGKCYVAVTTSKTGNRFLVSNTEPSPREVNSSDTWCSGGLINPDTSPVMISTWDTSLAESCREITLPVAGFSGTVNWGDGVTDNKVTHTYATAGEVKIRIDGTFSAWSSGYSSDDVKQCLLSVDRWGATKTTDLREAFSGANRLKHVEAIPHTTQDLRNAFISVGTNFTLGDLNTSEVTTMAGMFKWAPAFNSPVNFDTSKVTDMQSMFNGAQAFNQPVKFDTSAVTNMNYMFFAAYAFNQPVNFDTSQVTGTYCMFGSARAFNQPVNFDTRNVTDMGSIFDGASSFNQPVAFDTSKVTNMASMFSFAGKFNQPVNFDTSNVTNMNSMFRSASAFDQPVNFNTSRVTNMGGMFQSAAAFNQPVPFDTSSVRDMSWMFKKAKEFNQPLGFDTSKVTDMAYMLDGADAFDQNLSGWNVKAVTNHEAFARLGDAYMPKFAGG